MICDHGQLARQCDYCEKDAEIAELRAELDRVKAERDRYREALKDITNAVHEGDGGFCYEPHGLRPCSCHVATARQVLEGGAK